MAIVKFVSSSHLKQNRIFYSWIAKRILIFAAVLSILVLLVSSFISNFLRIEYLPVVISGFIVFFSVLGFLNRSFLQGFIKFNAMIFTLNIEMITRLIVGSILVYIGFSVAGATFGVLVSVVIGWLVTFPFLPKLRIFGVRSNYQDGRKLVSYGVPVLLQAIATTSLMSLDVILVKHYFGAHDAGLYAAASNLGKIIYFGTGPIGAVMFPIIAKRHSKGAEYKKVLVYSLFLTAILSLCILVFYYLFPEFAIMVLYGKEFLEATPLIFIFGSFFFVFALTGILANFFFSIGKTWIVRLQLAAALLQIGGILMFHNSLFNVVKISIACISFLFIGLLIYLKRELKSN